MKVAALLERSSWFQVSLALHAALGLSMYAVTLFQEDEFAAFVSEEKIPLDILREHAHEFVQFGAVSTCPHCCKPTSYRLRCTKPNCEAFRISAHRCIVARSCGVVVRAALRAVGLTLVRIHAATRSDRKRHHSP